MLGEYNAGTDFDNYNIDFMGQPLLEYDGSLNAYNTGIFCAKLDTNFNYIASYSEVVDETYHRLYAVDIKVDNQNNIYLLYYKQGSDYNSYDLILRKFNSYFFNLISTLTIAEDFWNGGGWNSHFKNATKLDIHNDNIVVSFDFDAGNHLDVNNQSLQHTGQGLHNWVIVSINTDMSINWHNHFTNYNQSYDQSKLLVRDKIYFIEGSKNESNIYGSFLYEFDVNTGELLSNNQFTNNHTADYKDILFDDNNDIYFFGHLNNLNEIEQESISLNYWDKNGEELLKKMKTAYLY